MAKKILILLSLAVGSLLVLSSLSLQSSQLIQADNLVADAQFAAKHKRVILILFSEHGCPYCEIAKDEALIPISVLPQYQDKVVVREVFANHKFFNDFEHNAITGYDFHQRYGVNFYPTVLIVNQHGQEITPRLVGIVDKDIYWAQVDVLIDSALKFLTPP